MTDQIKPIPLPTANPELFELIEHCNAEIAKTFALPRECFLPPRSRPTTVDLTPLFRKIYDNLGFKYIVDPALPDDTAIVHTGKETKIFRFE